MTEYTIDLLSGYGVQLNKNRLTNDNSIPLLSWCNWLLESQCCCPFGNPNYNIYREGCFLWPLIPRAEKKCLVTFGQSYTGGHSLHTGDKWTKSSNYLKIFLYGIKGLDGGHIVITQSVVIPWTRSSWLRPQIRRIQRRVMQIMNPHLARVCQPHGEIPSISLHAATKGILFDLRPVRRLSSSIHWVAMGLVHYIVHMIWWWSEVPRSCFLKSELHRRSIEEAGFQMHILIRWSSHYCSCTLISCCDHDSTDYYETLHYHWIWAVCEVFSLCDHQPTILTPQTFGNSTLLLYTRM